MPIFDIEAVRSPDLAPDPGCVAALADALGSVMGSPTGRTWVRLRRLDAACYAENGPTLAPDEWPVFVTVLLAHWPAPDVMPAQAQAITAAVAECLACRPDRVHVQYAPEATGRQAFGGQWVR